MSARTSRRRGFTLLELLIATSIMFITVGMATMAFLSQNKSLQSMDMSRVASESTRDALVHLESGLRNAGWGIDPRYVIDVSCATPPCRDSKVGPDELVFVTRNQAYRWETTAVACTAPSVGSVVDGCYWGNAWPIDAVTTGASPTVEVTLQAGQVLEKGRIVLATCRGGLKPVMLTLDATYGSATATGPETVTLTPLSPAALPYNNLTALETCHGEDGASLFLVDRHRYFVQTAGLPDPWLMLDSGLDLDGDGTLPPADTDDLLPLARNVVDLQVAYMLQPNAAHTAPDSNTDWILGNDGAAAAEEPVYALTPVYDTPIAHADRYTKSAGNVRGVRVTLTLRSSRVDPNRDANWAGDSLAGAENRGDTINVPGRQLFRTQSQVSLRNMESRSPFTF